jgi:hypothetical protein
MCPNGTTSRPTPIVALLFDVAASNISSRLVFGSCGSWPMQFKYTFMLLLLSAAGYPKTPTE